MLPTLKPLPPEPCLHDFPQLATKHRHRSRTFGRRQNVVQTISAATGLEDVDTTVVFQNNLKGGLGLGNKGRNFEALLGAHLLLRNTFCHAIVKWTYIMVSGSSDEREMGLEFRLSCSRHADLDQITYKVSWSMGNILNKDPRRRFAYGFTIENIDMRL